MLGLSHFTWSMVNNKNKINPFGMLPSLYIQRQREKISSQIQVIYIVFAFK